MSSHHEPFSALGPVDWANVPKDDLKPFLDGIFSEAQTVIESIPTSNKPDDKSTEAAAAVGRARAKTDSFVFKGAASPTATDGRQQSASPLPDHGTRRQTVDAAAKAEKLRKEWKEAKVNPRDNPLNVDVYKLAAKDGRGAWFARRSVHEGLSFDHWREGLDREFPETMKVQGAPGSGNIRGIGADKRVEDRTIADAGHLQVFQLSAQFPGPTAPRDFITLLLTSDASLTTPDHSRPLRQYMIVSKPCNHPECPPRQGIIRGSYESVELIREIPVENPSAKRNWSSADLSNTGSAGARPHDDSTHTMIEWLMVTRSDPGGSVPRFMVEKGTPPGIVGDAGKFINWVSSQVANDVESVASPVHESKSQDHLVSDGSAALAQTQTADIKTTSDSHDLEQGYGGVASSNGLYGIISGALGAASSVVPSSLLRGFSTGYESRTESSTSSQPAVDEADDESLKSETSSIRSFTSALEKSLTQEMASANGSNSDDRSLSQGLQPQEKELKKLQERRRKLEEKAAKLAERMEQKRSGDKLKDAAAIAKAQEKHEKEIAKQEAKYRRELRKLEEKREQEERKAEERRKKAIEREEKSNLTLELERAKAERDIALKRIEILESQVGELQSQNTMLVAKMGKMSGIDRTNSSASSLSKDLDAMKPDKGSPKLPER